MCGIAKVNFATFVHRKTVAGIKRGRGDGGAGARTRALWEGAWASVGSTLAGGLAAQRAGAESKRSTRDKARATKRKQVTWQSEANPAKQTCYF